MAKKARRDAGEGSGGRVVPDVLGDVGPGGCAGAARVRPGAEVVKVCGMEPETRKHLHRMIWLYEREIQQREAAIKMLETLLYGEK